MFRAPIGGKLGFAALVLFACIGEPKDGDSAGTSSDSYIEAVCRLYGAPTCTESAFDTCMFTIDFGGVEPCVDFYNALLEACPEGKSWMTANPEVVADCVSAYDAFDCASDQVCTETGEMTPELVTPCEALEAGLADRCGE